MNDIQPLSEDEASKSNAQTADSQSPMQNRSRLSKTLENNSKKTMTLSIIGILVIIALLALFGIPILERLAQLTSRDDSKSQTEEETIVVLPPYLDIPFEATNSAEITVTGTVDEGDSVKLYNNGKLVGEENIEDGAFEFTGVELREGDNQLKAKAILKKEESRFSETLTVQLRKEAPKLAIDYPQEGQSIGNKDGNRLQIEGSTDPNVTVTINGFKTIVNAEGKFKYTLQVQGGENKLQVVAVDDAGNKTEMERKFNYQ